MVAGLTKKTERRCVERRRNKRKRSGRFEFDNVDGGQFVAGMRCGQQQKDRRDFLVMKLANLFPLQIESNSKCTVWE